MLVKLGQVWVDPAQVIYIASSENTVSISIAEDGYVGATPIANSISPEEAETLRDEFAAIINNALTSQSFGGPPDEEAGPA